MGTFSQTISVFAAKTNKNTDCAESPVLLCLLWELIYLRDSKRQRGKKNHVLEITKTILDKSMFVIPDRLFLTGSALWVCLWVWVCVRITKRSVCESVCFWYCFRWNHESFICMFRCWVLCRRKKGGMHGFPWVGQLCQKQLLYKTSQLKPTNKPAWKYTFIIHYWICAWTCIELLRQHQCTHTDWIHSAEK